MKIDLRDVTFLFLVRLDSIERLENTITVTNQLCHYFNTNIIVLESDYRNNKVLSTLLNRKIKYLFVKDKDPILHKTFYYNSLIQEVNTPFFAIWDVDIIIDKKAINKAVCHLRQDSDVVYPYNGICYNVSRIIRNLFFMKKDIRVLYRHQNKMEYLYLHTLVGGAFFISKEMYIKAGGDNENHYGWGNDDYDRYFRYIQLGYKIYRVDMPLFHLYHPKVNNSSFRSIIHKKNSERELFWTKNSSKNDVLNHNRW